jgi:hypothetical protein
LFTGRAEIGEGDKRALQMTRITVTRGYSDGRYSTSPNVAKPDIALNAVPDKSAIESVLIAQPPVRSAVSLNSGAADQNQSMTTTHANATIKAVPAKSHKRRHVVRRDDRLLMHLSDQSRAPLCAAAS